MKVLVSKYHDKRDFTDAYDIELYPETDFEAEALEAFIRLIYMGPYRLILKVYRQDLGHGYLIHVPLDVVNKHELPDELKLR